MSTSRRLIAAITISWGWRRFFVASLAGAASSLALAPVFFLPVLLVTLPVLVWLLDGVPDTGNPAEGDAGPGTRRRRLGVYVQAFGIGWAFGFGYFMAGLYWIGLAFLVDAETFAWMLPFVAAALPGGLAIFTGLTTVIARAAWSRGAGRLVVLAASWTAFEAARGSILTGFAWNRLGQAFAGSDALVQGAAYVGDLGLTFVVVLIASAPATLADRHGFWRGWRAPGFGLVVLAGLWAAGDTRLSQAGENAVEGVRLRIVQPNIAQSEKWKPASRSGIIAGILEQSNAATSPQTMGIDGVTLLIWPETALPLLLQNDAETRAAIGALLPDETTLLTGGVTTRPGPSGRRQAYNSVLALDGEGRILTTYDKRRLVPFGEYLPFQEILERWGLSQLTQLPGGFTPGSGDGLMTVGTLPAFAPLICYEIIFSGNVAPDPKIDGSGRARWILNLTNDAWFGKSSGPHQHLAQARLRAVEEGLTVVRSANTGISAVISPYGRYLHRIDLGRKGIIDSILPAPAEATIFSRYRNAPVLTAVLLILVLGLILNGLVRRRHGR